MHITSYRQSYDVTNASKCSLFCIKFSLKIPTKLTLFFLRLSLVLTLVNVFKKIQFHKVFETFFYFFNLMLLF